MITGTIAVVFIIAMIAAEGDGEWGSVVLGAVIIAAVLALGSAGRQSCKAYNNCVNYWAEGGPDRRRK